MRKVMMAVVLSSIAVATNNAMRDVDLTAPTAAISIDRKEAKVDHVKRRREQIVKAIALQESSGDSTMLNKVEDAVGYLQIRKIMVREVNRLTGSRYTYEDRWSKTKSIDLFIKYNEVVNPEWDLEKACRLWNGGLSGMRKESTEWYYREVKAKFIALGKGR